MRKAFHCIPNLTKRQFMGLTALPSDQITPFQSKQQVTKGGRQAYAYERPAITKYMDELAGDMNLWRDRQEDRGQRVLKYAPDDWRRNYARELPRAVLGPAPRVVVWWWRRWCRRLLGIGPLGL